MQATEMQPVDNFNVTLRNEFGTDQHICIAARRVEISDGGDLLFYEEGHKCPGVTIARSIWIMCVQHPPPPGEPQVTPVSLVPTKGANDD